MDETPVQLDRRLSGHRIAVLRRCRADPERTTLMAKVE